MCEFKKIKNLLNTQNYKFRGFWLIRELRKLRVFEGWSRYLSRPNSISSKICASPNVKLMALNLLIFQIFIFISTIFLQSTALLNPRASPNPLAPTPYGFTSPPNSSFPISPLAPPPSNSLVPALFVIGDSTVDCGTNNFLGTFARADHLPYGRDFDTHTPTGRFCNGRIPVDFLGIVSLLSWLFFFSSFWIVLWFWKLSFRFDLCFFPLSDFRFDLLFFFRLFIYLFFLDGVLSLASWTSVCSELSWPRWSSGRYDSRSELRIS